MSDRYAAYSRLTLDYPSKRILRLTFNRPETYNSVDAETHTQLTNIWRDPCRSQHQCRYRHRRWQGLFSRGRF